MAETNNVISGTEPTTPPVTPPAPDPAPKPEDKQESQLLAGKFKTQDDLIKGYKALESKLGQKPDAVPIIPDPPKVELPEEITLDNYEDVLKKAGLSPESVLGEWQRDKKLSAASLNALNGIGIPKIAAGALAIGLSAAAEAQQAKVAAVVNESATTVFGNRDQYIVATQAASTLLNADEIRELNKLIVNPATSKIGMQTLKATIAMRSGGDTGNTIKPTGQPTGGSTALPELKSSRDAVAIMARARAGDPEAIRITSSRDFNTTLANMSPFTKG
jgi:hypothetical protein